MTPVTPHRMAGLSLIELMVALLISTILTLGLVEVFAASRAAYQMSEGLARVQENGRFAMDYLQRDLRMVGHFGCVNDQAHKLKTGHFSVHTAAGVGAPLDFSRSIQGFEANGTAPGQTLNVGAPTSGWTPGLPAHLAALGPRAGSDIVMLRFLRSSGAPITGIATGGASTTLRVELDDWQNLKEEGVANPTLFGMADCTYVDVFPGVGNEAMGTATANVAIDRYTSGNVSLYRAEAIAYYVANGASGRPALWRARWNAAGAAQAEELVEGIESLQLLYGQDQSVDVSDFTGFIANQVTAATIGSAAGVAGEEAWRRVGLVQVAVVASSVNPATSPGAVAAGPFALGVEVNAPDDGRYRTTYESTVAIRNRLYGQ